MSEGDVSLSSVTDSLIYPFLIHVLSFKLPVVLFVFLSKPIRMEHFAPLTQHLWGRSGTAVSLPQHHEAAPSGHGHIFVQAKVLTGQDFPKQAGLGSSS